MSYRTIALDDLSVNRANDRHGELENETAAIAWLFNNREQHMRNLTRDLVGQGQIYEPPLVSPDGAKFIVFDGNRRITCLKLLTEPKRAPTTELQEFFSAQRAEWKGTFPTALMCQVESDRDRVDDILFRRHTGSQNGVGQSTWDDRMKDNFIERTGKGGGLNVADEIEKRLRTAKRLPARKKIPRSTLNRLLSAEAFRNRVGITVKRGRFELTHDETTVMTALERIADDLAQRRIVLGDLWDVDGKRQYLDDLDREGILPTAEHALTKPKPVPAPPSPPTPRPTLAPKPDPRVTLIPDYLGYAVTWSGEQQRLKAIWEELQFHLKLADHPNAVAVMFRVLVELSIENYIKETKLATVHENDNLSKRAEKVVADLFAKKKIDKKYHDECKRLQNGDQLFSVATMNRWVHSPKFNPSPQHMTSMWDSLSDFVVLCINA